MRPGSREKVLDKYISARLTAAEERHVIQCAETAGLTKSEWCRRTLLNALNAAPETRLVVSELAAMRALFLTLHLEALKGSDLTQDRVRSLVEQADREKYALAEKRIQIFRAQDASSPSARENGESV